MNKNIVYGVLAVLVIAGALFLITKEDAHEVVDDVVVASFSDGTTDIDAAFDAREDTVTFTHEAVGTVTLPQAISASGARYANEDESIVFWEHQGEVTITKDDEIIFQGPAVEDTEPVVEGETSDKEDAETPAQEPDGEPSTETSDTLTTHVWAWEHTRLDGETITPAKADTFTLTFKDDGNVSGTTDCNNFFGTYTAGTSTLSFGALASTLMFCEGSQETEFRSPLESVTAYSWSASGHLVLTLADNAGEIHLMKD